MKYLLPGGESPERVNLLLMLTKIRSSEVRQAVTVYLVDGLPAVRAAARHGVALQNFHRAVDRLNEIAAIVEQIKELDFKSSVK
ncbi:hypothetical protein NFHSH190041_20350 [Shewanella sp. NFH-SH190041]|uniref:adhesin biosynthesis transcription regulatory family protein n=1 Tax=Shewanella sp. NFH-SH190041 TaxID=2950245 RepID=UPI0021C49A20|nr:adhesin biosynthesis transcription regulatory family protein [Shewanella sp. NFH-SH190041]BDM64583.1 hypothetical protein NFHSH190041_20350 [Shewanella sp. NFH-SH190041]